MIDSAIVRVLNAKLEEGARQGTLRCIEDAISSFCRSLQIEPDSCAKSVTREHVTAWLVGMRAAGLKEGTLLVRFRYLTIFFKTLVDLAILSESPCVGIKAPRARMPEVRFPADDALRALLDADLYRDPYGIRDLSIMRLLLSTGMRRIELVGMRFSESDGPQGIDFQLGLARVVGKGGKRRIVPLSSQVVVDLTSYLRELRPRLPGASGQAFWLGQRGPIRENTLNRIVNLRASAAGLGHLRPHQLRHAWANRMLSHEMAEGDLMVLGGWSSRAMLSRYGAYAATDRALRAARRVGDPLEREEVQGGNDSTTASRPFSISHPEKLMRIAKAK